MSGRRGPWRALGAVLLLASSLVVVVPAPVAAAPGDQPVPVPTLTEPPAGIQGHALWDAWYDPAVFGYEEQELLVSGTAVDAAGTPAPYTTRIIVHRPSDPARFNGIVLLDWVNVTAQFENGVDTILTRPMLLREGYAFVHMSAQQSGLCCLPVFTPKMWDPVRYAAISHPGDAWAFDIVTQIAQSFRQPPPDGGLDPMGAIGVGRVEYVLAAGQSQSGIKLHDYVAGWLPTHPSAVGIIDGILVHGNTFQPKTYPYPVAVPVINLLSEVEAVDDGVDPADLDPNVRLWEVAGAAHEDHWVGYQQAFAQGPRHFGLPKVGREQYDALLLTAGNYGEQVTPSLAVCAVGGASMPRRYVSSAAIHQLARWVAGGPAPRHGPRYVFSGGSLAKDADGHSIGGIRLPPIEVPVATYLPTACSIAGGITLPYTDLQLQQRYGSHAGYYARLAERTDAAVTAGWMLPEDAVDLMTRACAARNRFPATSEPCAPYTPPPFDTLGA
ncbi:MAG TPA: alpha/beta hydrolase domain-containing protein, partial [Acidimicrobiales bacterium]|nr:alpha/beta hydrolase domain-containing protein [Acidimicrobiales bacterium]